jgi:hypothetical protein
LLDLRLTKRRIQPRFELFERDVERVQREPRRFVARVGRAVAERDLRESQAPLAFREQRAQGDELRGDTLSPGRRD